MPERPRVLQMGPDPSLGGGMAAALRALLDSPLADAYELEVVPTYRTAAPARRGLVFLGALARLAVWSLRRRGRIVHVHATVRGSTYRKSICVLVAKLLGRRVLLQVHAGAKEVAVFRSRTTGPFLRLFRAAFAAADSVVAVSRASAAALESAYGISGVGVVPNAAPRIPAFTRQPSGGKGPLVAYLGGFANPAKGGDVLAGALAEATAAEPRLRVALAGPGELPPEAAALVSGSADVRWLGWLGPDEKDELMREAEIFAMPSRSEGLPMALLEAMAYGAAIVATEVGGIPETVRDGQDVLLVPAENPGALAAAILRLAADPELRARLGAAARARAERLDDVEVAGRVARIYASLV
ncbi:MAG TPA: glycosyltransferase family 4 protein [Solirubrobacterales bacterium]